MELKLASSSMHSLNRTVPNRFYASLKDVRMRKLRIHATSIMNKYVINIRTMHII